MGKVTRRNRSFFLHILMSVYIEERDRFRVSVILVMAHGVGIGAESVSLQVVALLACSLSDLSQNPCKTELPGAFLNRGIRHWRINSIAKEEL
jgi:hypothetical protein